MRTGFRPFSNRMLYKISDTSVIGNICSLRYFIVYFFANLYIGSWVTFCLSNEWTFVWSSFFFSFPFYFPPFFSLSNTDNSILIFLFLFKLLYVQYIVRFLYMQIYSYIRDSYLLVECILWVVKFVELETGVKSFLQEYPCLVFFIFITIQYFSMLETYRSLYRGT